MPSAGINQTTDGPNRKGKGRSNSPSLFLTLDIHLTLLSDNRDPICLTFGPQDLNLQLPCPPSPPTPCLVLRPSDLDWIIPTVSLVLQLLSDVQWHISACIIAWPNSHNKFYLCIFMYPTILFSRQHWCT